MPPVIFIPTQVSHICSGSGDFRKITMNELLKFKAKFIPAVLNGTESGNQLQSQYHVILVLL